MTKSAIGRWARQHVPPALYQRLCRLYDSPRLVVRRMMCVGFGRTCPLCGAHWRRFLSDPGEPSPLFSEVHVVGGGPIEQALCPRCKSFERERHVYLYLQRMTTVFTAPTRLLHVAPERRLEPLLRAAGNVEYVSGDLAPGRAQHRLDVTAIDFPDGSFDVVLCNHVLEHIPDDARALAELFRVIRPGGWAMLQVPLVYGIDTREDRSASDPADMLLRFGQRDHIRIYGAADYERRLTAAGFEVTKESISERFGARVAERFGLLPDEQLFIARRPAAPAPSAGVHSQR